MANLINPIFVRIIATINLVLLFLLAWYLVPVASSVVESFEEIFSGFEPLPWATRFIVDFPEALWVLPVINAIAYMLYWFNFRYSIRIQAICTVLSILTIPLFIFLLYLPIFSFGEEIGS